MDDEGVLPGSFTENGRKREEAMRRRACVGDATPAAGPVGDNEAEDGCLSVHARMVVGPSCLDGCSTPDVFAGSFGGAVPLTGVSGRDS